MNRKKYILITFLIISFILIYLFINKNNTIYLFSSYNGFEIEGDTIINYEGSGNIVIPSTVNGTVITKIGDYAFSNLEITSVIFPNTIIEIGDYAFSNNNISYLEIPDSVKNIGEGAFIHNNISDLSIGSNTVIGNACFNDNSFSFDNSFFYKINEDGTIDYTELISYGGKVKGNVEIPTTVNNINLNVIGEKAFFDVGIISVSIPTTVYEIKGEAFKDNYLVEIFISNNINSIAVDAFSNNDYLTEIIVDNSDLLNYPWGADKSNIHYLK